MTCRRTYCQQHTERDVDVLPQALCLPAVVAKLKVLQSDKMVSEAPELKAITPLRQLGLTLPRPPGSLPDSPSRPPVPVFQLLL